MAAFWEDTQIRLHRAQDMLELDPEVLELLIEKTRNL